MVMKIKDEVFSSMGGMQLYRLNLAGMRYNGQLNLIEDQVLKVLEISLLIQEISSLTKSFYVFDFNLVFEKVLDCILLIKQSLCFDDIETENYVKIFTSSYKCSSYLTEKEAITEIVLLLKDGKFEINVPEIYTNFISIIKNLMTKWVSIAGKVLKLREMLPDFDGVEIPMLDIRREIEVKLSIFLQEEFSKFNKKPHAKLYVPLASLIEQAMNGLDLINSDEAEKDFELKLDTILPKYFSRTAGIDEVLRDDEEALSVVIKETIRDYEYFVEKINIDEWKLQEIKIQENFKSQEAKLANKNFERAYVYDEDFSEIDESSINDCIEHTINQLKFLVKLEKLQQTFCKTDTLSQQLLKETRRFLRVIVGFDWRDLPDSTENNLLNICVVLARKTLLRRLINLYESSKGDVELAKSTFKNFIETNLHGTNVNSLFAGLDTQDIYRDVLESATVDLPKYLKIKTKSIGKTMKE